MPSRHAPDDTRLSSYITALEAGLTRARGRDVAVVGRDFELARSWYAAGVPVSLVLSTLEEQRTAGYTGHSLEYLRPHVEARARRSFLRRAAPPAAKPAAADGGIEAARDWLARVRAWLDGPAAAPASLETLRGTVDALARRLAAAPALAPDELGAALDALDSQLTAAALLGCDDALLARFRAEAHRTAERQRGRVDPRALERALERYVARRARAAREVPERP